MPFTIKSSRISNPLYLGGVPSPLLGLVLALSMLCVGDLAAAQTRGFSSGGSRIPVFSVQEFPLSLDNGDAADVYAPRIHPRRRARYRDAFPMVALLQGANVDKAQYRGLGRRLARRGFVVVVPNHWRSFPGFPFPMLFGEVEVVTAVHDTLLVADADPQSPLRQIIDTETMATLGHSLGGRVALEAIAGVCSINLCSGYAVDADFDGRDDNGFATPSALMAAALYGTNLVNFTGDIDDLDTSAAAVALIQGSLDGVATPEEAAASYPTLEQPRALITVHGANHYGITDDNKPAGAAPDPSAPTLSQDAAGYLIGRWTRLWLQAQLLQDPRAEYWVYTVGGDFSGLVDVVTD